MSVLYSFSVSSDISGGVVDSTSLVKQLQVSSIVTALDRIDVSGDDLKIYFKDTLSSGDESLLESIVANHVPESSSDIVTVQINPTVGLLGISFDGIGIVAGSNEQIKAYYDLSEDFHIQGIFVFWENCANGDNAKVFVTKKTAHYTLTSLLNSGANSIDVGSSVLAGAYDPENGAKNILFWDDDAEDASLLEVIPIDNVSGSVITFSGNLSQNVPSGGVLMPQYSGYSPVRGTTGIDGGLQLLGTNSLSFNNETGVTSLVIEGLSLLALLTTQGGIPLVSADRTFVINFLFREKIQN